MVVLFWPTMRLESDGKVREVIFYACYPRVLFLRQNLWKVKGLFNGRVLWCGRFLSVICCICSLRVHYSTSSRFTTILDFHFDPTISMNRTSSSPTVRDLLCRGPKYRTCSELKSITRICTIRTELRTAHHARHNFYSIPSFVPRILHAKNLFIELPMQCEFVKYELGFSLVILPKVITCAGY